MGGTPSGGESELATLIAPASETLRSDGGPPHRPQEAPVLRPGDAIGRYLIEAQLGAGGMGTVFAARDPDLDRRVAIKLLHPQGPQELESGGPQRLLREAQAMAKLAHPNVVAVYDVGVVGGRLFVAMEIIDGGDLQDWLAAAPRTWREILAAFIQAGEGLAAAHRAGIIHRDFKLANVMVTSSGRVCVGDFGLAAAEDRPSSPLADPQELSRSWLGATGSLTVPGMIMGTPAYMAPEQMIGRQVTVAADTFAFCVALYEALYGHRPFHGEHLAALYLAIHDGELDPRPPRLPIPRSLERLLRRGLADDPNDRPSLDRELLPALRALIEPRWRRRLLTATAVAAVAAVAALPGLLRPSEPDIACTGASSRLDQLTAPARLGELQGAFAATGAVHHAETWERVDARLHAYADAWRDARRRACEATHHRGEHSVDLLDRRNACLDRQLDDLDGALQLLAAADRKVVDNAVALLRGLPTPRDCDPAALLATAAAPITPEFEAIDAELRQLKRLSIVGRPEAAMELATRLLERLEGLDAPHLRARALILRAHLAYKDHGSDAERWLREALAAALAVGDDRSFAEAAADQLGLKGSDEDARELWVALAEAALARHGGAASSVRAKVLTNYGNALRSHYAVEAAIRAHQEVLDLRRTEGEGGVLLADALFNLSADLAALERFGEARPLLDEAVAIWRRELGALHPRMLIALHNLALFRKYEGDYHGGLQLAEEAAALADQTHGEGNSKTTHHLLLLGNLMDRTGDPDGAEVLFRRVREIIASDPSHAATEDRDALIGLAAIAVDRRDLGTAAPLVAELRGHLDGDISYQLSLFYLEIELAWARGDLDAVSLLLERTREVLSAMDHVPSLLAGDVMIHEAALSVRRDQPERALTILRELENQQPLALHHITIHTAYRRLLAGLLAETHPDRARAHIDAALTALEPYGPGYDRHRDELRTLLTGLPPAAGSSR